MINAIICDIDGTLAEAPNPPDDAKERKKYFYSREFIDDMVRESIRNIVDRYVAMGIEVLLVSGRDEWKREDTEKWLEKHKIPYAALLMRGENDNRNDNLVKQDIYDTEIKGKYNVLFVLDDRDRVVKMWRENGLTCLQVNYGAF